MHDDLLRKELMMALFEHFPYVNIQNLNLNWIIKVLENAVAELKEIQTNWEGVRETANTAKTTADAAATKAENARITANGSMTKAISAEDTAKMAKTAADTAEMNSNAAQDTAVEAQAIANEANETAARRKYRWCCTSNRKRSENYSRWSRCKSDNGTRKQY